MPPKGRLSGARVFGPSSATCGRVVLHSLQGNLVSSVPHLTAAQHGDKVGLLLYCALLLYRW